MISNFAASTERFCSVNRAILKRQQRGLALYHVFQPCPRRLLCRGKIETAQCWP